MPPHEIFNQIETYRASSFVKLTFVSLGLIFVVQENFYELEFEQKRFMIR